MLADGHVLMVMTGHIPEDPIVAKVLFELLDRIHEIIGGAPAVPSLEHHHDVPAQRIYWEFIRPAGKILVVVDDAGPYEGYEHIGIEIQYPPVQQLHAEISRQEYFTAWRRRDPQLVSWAPWKGLLALGFGENGRPEG